MTFNSPALTRLRAIRAQPETHPSAAQVVIPEPVAQTSPTPKPRPRPRPSPPPAPPAQRPPVSARAGMAGHCGTCTAFTPTPDEGLYMGRCSHGRGAFESWARHSGHVMTIHEAARCMTLPFPRWALRAGTVARPDSDLPREVSR